jgi:hypothetical protein
MREEDHAEICVGIALYQLGGAHAVVLHHALTDDPHV